MTKDNSELLLDGLNHSVEWAESLGHDDLAEFLAGLYQVGGQVTFGNGDEPADSPSAVDLEKTLKERVSEHVDRKRKKSSC